MTFADKNVSLYCCTIYTVCPTRYRTRNFFNNFTRVATIRRTTDTFLFISHTTNALLFKFPCNIFIGVRIIKEMPGSVASGTPCTTMLQFQKFLRSAYSAKLILIESPICWKNWSKIRIICKNHAHTRELPDLAVAIHTKFQIFLKLNKHCVTSQKNFTAHHQTI
jgi:hypothetical protein